MKPDQLVISKEHKLVSTVHIFIYHFQNLDLSLFKYE